MTESVIQKTLGKSMKKLPVVNAVDVPQAVLSIEQLFNLADALQRNAQDVQCLELYSNWLKATTEPNRYLVHFNHACLLQKLGKEKTGNSFLRKKESIISKIVSAAWSIKGIITKKILKWKK